ncbi:MAG: hypothetical protein KC636_26000 [Myxococcales bacterium]|nr:hypothetical protein [Myxococcales bacterium]
MFEHYMHYQASDPIRRRRIMAAGIVSGTATFSMLLFTWAANKMDITRVEAPTVEYLMVQIQQAESTPPPPPPPPPAGDTQEEEEEEEEIPEEEVPEELVQPDDTPDRVPDTKKSAGAGKPKIPGGVPGGVPGGIPGGVVGGVLGGQLGGQLGGVATKQDTKAGAPVPYSALKQSKIYEPPIPKNKLASTKAFMFDKRGGSVTIHFCIDVNGKVDSAKVKKKFPGDPKVDQIMREHVSQMRFKPYVVGGKKRRACSDYKFNIEAAK